MMSMRYREVYAIKYSCPDIDSLIDMVGDLAEYSVSEDYHAALSLKNDMLSALEDLRSINACLRNVADRFADEADELEAEVYDLKKEIDGLQNQLRWAEDDNHNLRYDLERATI